MIQAVVDNEVVERVGRNFGELLVRFRQPAFGHENAGFDSARVVSVRRNLNGAVEADVSFLEAAEIDVVLSTEGTEQLHVQGIELNRLAIVRLRFFPPAKPAQNISEVLVDQGAIGKELLCLLIRRQRTFEIAQDAITITSLRHVGFAEVRCE